MHKKLIAVIGGKKANDEIYKIALQVGKIIAINGLILICGGKGGVMEAAAKGAKQENGITIGILPGGSKEEANKYIDIAIPTDISNARNAIIARACDLAIAINGGYGTLSEIALCLAMKKTVLGIKTHNIDGVTKIDKAKEINEFL